MSLRYLRLDPDTLKESESDHLTSHVEYLALQSLLPAQHRVAEDTRPAEVSALAAEAIGSVRELFDHQSSLIIANRIAEGEAAEKLDEYAWRAQLESMAVRGSAYQEHHERVIEGCLSRFDAECLDLLGFTARDALQLPQAIHDIVDGERLSARAR